MTALRTLLATAACAAALTGCAAVGPNFQRPAVPATQAYAMAGDKAVAQAAVGAPRAGPWWRDFGPPELDQVMGEALAGNRTLEAANATLAQAQASLAAAKGGLQPTLDLNGGAQRERLNLSSFGFAGGFPGISNNPEFSLYSVGATASYPLDLFGGQRRRVESAAARGEAAARQADAAALTLTGQVATAAVQIAGLRAEIEALNAVIADDHRNIELVAKAQAAGSEGEGARVDAQTQLAQDEALLPPLNQMQAIARHQLALLVGKAPADWTAPDFDLAGFALSKAVPVAVPSELVRERPDILQAEADLHAATADVGVATAALYPSVNLTASLTQSALSPEKIFDLSSTAYTLGASLAAPILDGGRRRAERQAAREAARGSLATYEQTVLKAFNEVADALQALANDDQAIAADERALALAEDNLRLARIAYQAGGTGLLPLVDAQRTAGEDRRTLAAARTRRGLDTIQLIIAAGARWRAP